VRKGPVGLESSLQILLFDYFKEDEYRYCRNTFHEIVELVEAVYVIIHHIKIQVHPEHFPQFEIGKQWNCRIEYRDSA